MTITISFQLATLLIYKIQVILYSTDSFLFSTLALSISSINLFFVARDNLDNQQNRKLEFLSFSLSCQQEILSQ